MEAEVTREGNQIYITIPGPVMGKPRMTQSDKWKQRPPVMRYRAWCDKARKIAGPLPDAHQVRKIDLVAFFEPPKSWSKKKRLELLGELHRQVPDSDNVLKSQLDAFWKNDSAIAHCEVSKWWGEETGIYVTITLNEGTTDAA